MALEIIRELARNEEVLIFGGLIICGVIAIVFGTVASMVNRASRERTRREIAAYIAEGSMSAEQGERLLKAEPEEA